MIDKIHIAPEQPCPLDDSLKLHESEVKEWCAHGCSVTCASRMCDYLSAREAVRQALTLLGYDLYGVDVYEVSYHRYTAYKGHTLLGIYDTDKRTFVD